MPDPSRVGDRREYNEEILRAGWATFRQFIKWASTEDPTVERPYELPEKIDFTNVYEGREEQTNEYETFVMECLNVPDRSDGFPLAVQHQDGVLFRPRRICTPTVERDIDVQLPGNSNAMIRYFKERFSVEEGTYWVQGEFMRYMLIRGWFPHGEVPDQRTIQTAGGFGHE